MIDNFYVEQKGMLSIYSAITARNFRVVYLICDILKEENKQQMINRDYMLESKILDGTDIILSMTETNESKNKEDGGH